MEAQAEHVIQDLKSQIIRLSEERAIYYALATQAEQENEKLKKEIGVLNCSLNMDRGNT